MIYTLLLIVMIVSINQLVGQFMIDWLVPDGGLRAWVSAAPSTLIYHLSIAVWPYTIFVWYWYD